jgi:cell surface protein SprA
MIRGVVFKRFLPVDLAPRPNATPVPGLPLIRAFNLDRLNVQNDPQPDGVFDFVPGITINPTTGRVYFPVLEPFGSDLAELLSEEDRAQFVYQELYDSTIFQAREFPEKNRFAIRGSYKIVGAVRDQPRSLQHSPRFGARDGGRCPAGGRP